jgi:Flp pilus assembly protein TadD
VKTTLSFVDHLFAKGMELEKRGCLAEACRMYQRLLHIRPLTRKLAGKTAGRLGKLQMERGQFASARRHLTIAAARLADNAEYQSLLARAIEADDTCDPGLAGQPYRECAKLEPDNPRYLIELARFVAQDGGNEEAIDLYRRALEMGADDPEIAAHVAEGLRDLGEPEEAQTVLRQAQFRHARDRRFLQIRRAQQFQTLWTSQQRCRSRFAEDKQILSFVRPAWCEKVTG